MLGDFRTNHPRPQTQHIHIVVFHALPRREVVVARGRANPFELVGRHARARAATADQHRALRLPAEHRQGHRLRVVRIVHRIRGVRPQVPSLVPLLAQVQLDAERDGAVVLDD